MLKLANRAKMTTATTGTGTITLGSAASGYQSFAAAGVVDGDVVRYVIEDGTNWEIGQGTYTASGTTLSRTVLESSNSDNPISLSGSASVFISAAAEDVAKIQIDTYTTAGSTTWTKPSWAKFVKIILVGGGGGGGSGKRDATTLGRGGGAGGTGSAIVSWQAPASFFGNTETVVVGSGGLGGASITTNSTGGASGANGTRSKFGSLLQSPGGSGGNGGTASTSSSGSVVQVAPGLMTSQTAAGGNGNNTDGNGASTIDGIGITSGAGGPGAQASSTTAQNGKRGGNITGESTGLIYAGVIPTTLEGGLGGTGGNNGGNGNFQDILDFRIATGGGAGSYATGRATGAGGNGAQPGGGGGGGAASDNGFASGAGGNGGDGWVRVISWA